MTNKHKSDGKSQRKVNNVSVRARRFAGSQWRRSGCVEDLCFVMGTSKRARPVRETRQPLSPVVRRYSLSLGLWIWRQSLELNHEVLDNLLEEHETRKQVYRRTSGTGGMRTCVVSLRAYPRTMLANLGIDWAIQSLESHRCGT